MIGGMDLRERRLELGLSQADIARKAGTCRQTIVSLERKTLVPLSVILDAYGLMITPMASTKESIETLKEQIMDAVKDEFGNDCRVKISIELCGNGEE